jgi:hypothetical protein
MSVDPDLAETDQAYAYAGDDPVNEDDPSGLAPCGPSKGQNAVVGTWQSQYGPTYTLYCGVPKSYGYRHIVAGGHFGREVNGFVLG